MPEDAINLRKLHQDFVREAIKQGVPVEKNVLDDLNVNPQYVDKRIFDDAMGSEDNLFQADNRIVIDNTNPTVAIQITSLDNLTNKK